MNSTADEDTHETEGTAENEINNLKLYVLGSIIILTLLGNFLILFLVLSRHYQQKSTTSMSRVHYFMLHLSFADVITAFLTLLPELIWTVTWPYFYGGNFVCKTVKFLQMLGPYLSSYVLSMTALDRFLAICFPLTNLVWISTKQHIMIAIAWIVSIILCIPQAFIFSAGDKNEYTCNASWEPNWGMKAYVTWFSVSNFFIPLAILVFTNVCICITIWKIMGKTNTNPKITINLPMTDINDQIEPQTTQLDELNGSTDQDIAEQDQLTENTNLQAVPPVLSKSKTSLQTPQLQQPNSINCDNDLSGISRAKMRSVQQMVVIVLTYIASSTPFIFAQLWSVWVPSKAVGNAMVWLFWLLTLNSLVNPWIYLAFNSELRAPLKNLFRDKLCRNSSSWV